MKDISEMEIDEMVTSLIAQVQPGAVGEWVWTNPLGGRTYRLVDSDRITYLKVASDRVPSTHDLTVEAERMRWVQGRFLVPQLLDSGRQDNFSWLLTAQLPGTPASDQRWKANPRQTAEFLGRAVRAFHDALVDDAAECPWSWRVTDRFNTGRQLAEAKAMLRTAPAENDLVVSHGDLCAPNVLLHPGGDLAGLVDLGKLGVADRAADLGCHIWSLEFNGMGDQTEHFLDTYGFEGNRAHVSWYRDYYIIV